MRIYRGPRALKSRGRPAAPRCFALLIAAARPNNWLPAAMYTQSLKLVPVHSATNINIITEIPSQPNIYSVDSGGWWRSKLDRFVACVGSYDLFVVMLAVLGVRQQRGGAWE